MYFYIFQDTGLGLGKTKFVSMCFLLSHPYIIFPHNQFLNVPGLQCPHAILIFDS